MKAEGLTSSVYLMILSESDVKSVATNMRSKGQPPISRRQSSGCACKERDKNKSEFSLFLLSSESRGTKLTLSGLGELAAYRAKKTSIRSQRGLEVSAMARAWNGCFSPEFVFESLPIKKEM